MYFLQKCLGMARIDAVKMRRLLGTLIIAVGIVSAVPAVAQEVVVTE